MHLRLALFALMLPVSAIAEVPANWSFYPGYFLPGQNGTVIANIDGAGNPEAIITGSAVGGFSSSTKLHLATLEYVGSRFATTGMRVIDDGWFINGAIQSVSDSNGGPDHVVGALVNNSNLDTVLVSWTGKPLVEAHRVSVPDNFRLHQVADIDGDGQLEALGCICGYFYSEGRVAVIDLATGAAEWTDTASSAFMGAGQLDADAALELVLGTTDGPGRILDGASRQQQWSYPDGFRGRPAFGNFRGNATSLEFAIVQAWGPAKVFVSQPIFSPVADVETGQVNSFDVLDVNADGNDDLVVGEGQWGSIVAYSTVTGQSLFSWPNADSGVSGLALGDLDGASGLEIVFGAGLDTTGRDSVNVFDANTGTREYVSGDERGPHSSVLHLDIEGNGSKEVVFATLESESGYAGSNLVVLDAASGIELRRRASVLDPWGDNNPGLSMTPIEIDGDGISEIVVASGMYYDGVVAVVDGVSLLDRWRVTLPGTSVIHAVAKLRFNGDAIDDVVVAAPNRFIVLDGRNGTELYRSVTFVATARPTLAVGNADADPQHEVAFSVGNSVYVVDPTLGLVESFASVSSTIQSMRFEMLSGQCSLTVVLASRLDRLDCASGAALSTRDFGMTASYVDFPTDSTGELLISDGRRVGRLMGDVLVSRSRVLGSSIGAFGRGTFAVNGDKIVAFLGGDQSVSSITLPLETALFADGLEDR